MAPPATRGSDKVAVRQADCAAAQQAGSAQASSNDMKASKHVPVAGAEEDQKSAGGGGGRGGGGLHARQSGLHLGLLGGSRMHR